jgi:hypothetical protein
MLSALARAARAHGNVLLTGDGADEVLCGYRSPRAWFDDGRLVASDELRVGPPMQARLSEWGYKQGHVDLLGHGFVKVDQATAENAMEARCPFLDWDLISFARAIPATYWRRANREPKHPLRQHLLAEGFPPWFVRRRKLGFAMPFRYVLASQYAMMREALQRNDALLTDVGVGSHKPSSYVDLFRRFTFFWRRFILARVLERGNTA